MSAPKKLYDPDAPKSKWDREERLRFAAVLRPYLRESGGTTWVQLYLCQCDGRRGPEGGVCGNCGKGITTPEELAQEGLA